MHNKSSPIERAALLALGTLGSLAGMALWNGYRAQKAEGDNSPKGEFVDVQGVRLHYVARGEGPPLVLLHGNGSMVEDFECSGLIEKAAERYRVITFDRPGYGHSSRPDHKAWTPDQQAELFLDAFDHLEIRDPIVFGHSWGTLVALALALRHPKCVKGLVLASGYYSPTARVDAALASVGAIPVLGTILRHTLLPVIGRAAWGFVIRKFFTPCGVPMKFSGFPKEMALRPSQLRAGAQECALMVPSTKGLLHACRYLSLPVAVLCGAGDQVVDPKQSATLQKQIKNSSLRTLVFNGHMVHHTATDQVMAAIDEVGVAGRA